MKLKKIRNALLVVLALALVSATTVAITWAAVTGKKLDNTPENKFTNNPEIGLEFQEPTFDSLTWGVDRTKNNDGDDTNVPSSGTLTNKPVLPNGETIDSAPELGYNIARRYIAGQTIPKNPQLRNSTDVTFETTNYDQNETTSDEWVAMTVKYSLTIPEANVFRAAQDNEGTGSKTNPIMAEAITALTGDYLGETITFENYGQFVNAIASVMYIPTDAVGNARNLENAQSGHRTESGDYAWTDISESGEGGTVWMYKHKLCSAADYAADQDLGSDATGKVNETTTLFDCVKINDVSQEWVDTGAGYLGLIQLYELHIEGLDESGDDFDQTIYVTALPEFRIDLAGYAVQGDNVAYGDADDVLKKFIASKTA